MKALLLATGFCCLLMFPVAGEAQRVQREAVLRSRHARLEAARELRRARIEASRAMREAMRDSRRAFREARYN